MIFLIQNCLYIKYIIKPFVPTKPQPFMISVSSHSFTQKLDITMLHDTTQSIN